MKALEDKQLKFTEIHSSLGCGALNSSEYTPSTSLVFLTIQPSSKYLETIQQVKVLGISQVWWHKPLILVFRRPKRPERGQSLNLRPVWSTEWRNLSPVFKTTKTKTRVCWLLSQRTRVQFPVPMVGGSQLVNNVSYKESLCPLLASKGIQAQTN